MTRICGPLCGPQCSAIIGRPLEDLPMTRVALAVDVSPRVVANATNSVSLTRSVSRRLSADRLRVDDYAAAY